MLTPVSLNQFRQLEERHPYYRGRWPYLQAAIGVAESVRPESVLEVGPGVGGVPLFEGAHTMDVSGAPTFTHDATIAPWPFADKQYDLVMALQVWEHLRGRQRRAFREALRVGRHVLLSFPYKWRVADVEHQGIDMERIRHWTCGARYVQKLLVQTPPLRQRLILLFESPR